MAGRIRTAKRDLSFVTGHGSSILINSELFGRNYSKFGQTSMETIPKILCGSTNGKSMALVLHLTPNLDLNNSILTREFNGLVVHLFLSIQTSSQTYHLQVKNYHITKILSQHLIVPSMSTRYNVTLIHKALKDVIGAIPSLSCEYDKAMLYYYPYSSV